MKTRKTVLLVSLLLLGVVNFTFADVIKFMRQPHICNGKIAFCYHGDIWVADADGRDPYRLTNHIATDADPRFSPDGELIAFTSNRMGNNDIWVVPVEGGQPRQLTFHATGDSMVYWTGDGKRVIFRTSRKGAWGSPLYSVDLEGSLPIPFDIDLGSTGMISHDGKYLAFNRDGYRGGRKHYKGNRSTDVWIQDLETKKITQLTDKNLEDYESHVQDCYPMWGADGMIYFMSERDDTFNIWKIAPAGGEPVQVTFHKKDGVQNPTISPDGKTIIYENEFELWKLNLPDGRGQKITISLSFDDKENMFEYQTVDSECSTFAANFDGSYAVVENLGEMFMVPSDPKVGEMKRLTESSWKEQPISFSPDGKYLLYMSDESLEEELWLLNVESRQKRQLTTHESRKSQIRWSADSKTIALVANNILYTIDVESGEMTKVLYHEGGVNVSDWTKDKKWFVFTRTLEDDYNREIFLYNVDTQEEINITGHDERDQNGKLVPGYQNIVFTSNRSGANHLFVLPFKKVTIDPDDPLLRESSQDLLAASGEGISAQERYRRRRIERKIEERRTSSRARQLDIDFEGIDRRAVQLTPDTDSVSSIVMLSDDGKTIYYTGSDADGSGLFSIDILGENRKKIASGSFRDLKLSPDGKTWFFREGNALNKMAFDGKDKTKIEFSFTIKVDKPGLWEQIFEESWRVMKYRFYDENMHGFDWAVIKTYYKPLLKYVGENQDLFDLTNEMIGELNASHVGLRGPSGKTMPSTYSTKFLGFEMEPDNDFYKVTHIYWNGPADKEWIDLEVGDYVVSIDGKNIRAGDNYWKILNNLINDYVTVEVNTRPSSRDARQIRIKPVSSLREIKYQEWIKKNRDYVKEVSDGQIAYVHIRSMNQSSLEIFEQEINKYHMSKGIVIDIRYNGGGNIDQQLIDILERRPFGFWNSRWGTRIAGRRPRQLIDGPKVMLINHRSGSDSEVTPAAFRDLQLGRIVGQPTAAAVIATGSQQLMGGCSIRTPGSLATTYDPTKPNNFGINLENYGVPPDVFVENTPDDHLTGFDRELDTAVREALRMLKEKIN
ncbi:S41 family peptidase [Planctomycetota bacterium]